MKKIVFGITGLTIGGAERVLVDLSNALVETYDITIFTLYGKGELASELDSRIHLESYQSNKYSELGCLKRIWISLLFQITPLRQRIYRKYIKDKFDVEVSFLEGPITWLFSGASKARKIVWVHNDITKAYGSGMRSNLKKEVDRVMYQKYDDIVFVSLDNIEKFQTLYPNNTVPKTVIYNYLDRDLILSKSKLSGADELKTDAPSFVQVSRLTEQKGIERLLFAHQQLIEEGMLHHVYIVGTGPLYDKLESLISSMNVSDTFHLLGQKTNPYPYIKQADYFLLASHFEGYGMVIEEAKLLGKYILITNTAAREAIKNYPDALLMENSTQGIIDGMREVLIHQCKPNTEISYHNDTILEEVKLMLEGKQ